MATQSANPPDLITLNAWAGVNQSTKSRSQINDQEVWWAENFFPTAEGQFRTAYGPSAPIYTAPAGVSILRMFFGRVNDTIGPSGLMFLSNGTVDQVALNTNAVTHLGAIWTPTAPQYFADAKVWSPQQTGYTTGAPGGWVIGSPAGLYAFDGTTVTAPGAPAPTWLTNNSPNTAGWPGTMPSANALPGIWSLEVFQQRLWVAGKTVIAFSAPSNGADFVTADGGGTFPYFGDQLVTAYTTLQAAGGFLYLFGDSMINTISWLQLQGSGTPTNPFTTTFLDANIDPQVGQRFFRHVGLWNHAFTMWCGDAIHVLAGNQTTPISAKLTYLYQSLNPSPFQPTFAPAHIFGTKWMLCLGTFTDPWNVARPLMLCWNGKEWTLASQRVSLTQIGTYEENSTLTPYGTDGTSLYQLFAQPDPTLQKRLLTKQYKGPKLLTIKDWKRTFAEMRDYHGGPEGVSVTGTHNTGGGSIPNGAQDVSFQINPNGYDLVPQPLAGAGIWSSLDLSTYSPDFAFETILMAYDERTIFGA